MDKETVNIQNSRVWIKCNQDTRSNQWRNKFISEHGGEFVTVGRSWKWQNIHIEDKSKYELKDSDGKITIVENLSKFCRENELNKSAIHKVINGERTHHKGYTCRKI